MLDNLIDAGDYGPGLGSDETFPRDEEGDPWYHDLWELRQALAAAEKERALFEAAPALREALRQLVRYNEADPDLYDGDDDGTLGRIMYSANAALA